MPAPFTTSLFFQNYSHPGEQQLMQDLVDEMIATYGVDCQYIARTPGNYDKLYGEDDQSSYTYSWMLAMYIKDVFGFEGDGQLISKFAGAEIRDQIRVSISRYAFEQIISSDANFPDPPRPMPGPANRPREGDLIWFPDNQKCFKIMFVNLTDMFWTFGKLYTWECTCELFEYGSETFNTGIPEIDRIQLAGDMNILTHEITDYDGTPLLLDPYSDNWVIDQFTMDNVFAPADNDVIDQEANNYISNVEVDPFGDGTGPSV